MSGGTQNISDEQAVVGEPALHPHQAVVMGEPPEAVVPVLGEPAFANGLQDQQPIHPSSAEETSANGVQSVPHIPLHEEGLASVAHVSAPDEESTYLQQAPSAEASESGIREADTHQLEPPVVENPGLSGALVDDVSGASDAHVVRSTTAEASVNANAYDTVRSAEEDPAADIPEDVEITHILDSPSEAPPSVSEALTENPYAALDEDLATAAGEILVGDTAFLDGAPTSNASSAPDEISSKGPGDQQEEASLSLADQGKQAIENSSSSQTDTDDGPLEGSKVNVYTAETEQGSQGDILGQESDSKEANIEKDDTGPSLLEHTLLPEVDQAIERDALGQRNDLSEDILPESETITRDAGSKEASQPESSTVVSSTSNKDKVNENHTAPTISELQSNEETLDEAPPVDSSAARQGTRDMAVEDCLGNEPHAVEASFPPAANGNNGYQYVEDGPVEREQDLPKVDDDAGAEVEKPNFRSKLPLIFTGLAIAAVGVAVASISRPH